MSNHPSACCVVSPKPAWQSNIPEMIRRELSHAGAKTDGLSFSAGLLAWVEVA